MVRKAKLGYQQFNNISEGLKPWKNKDINKTITSIKRQKHQYLNNFGKDLWRKKLSKGNVNRPAQSHIGLKPMELNNKITSGVKEG